MALAMTQRYAPSRVKHCATSLKMTRHQKRKIDEIHVEGHEELDAASLREHEEFTKVKNISTIELGRYEIETWYFSPFPPEYNDTIKLFFCEFCLNFMKRKEQLQRHMLKRKSESDESEASKSSKWAASPGYAGVADSPLQTPISGRKETKFGRSKTQKNLRSLPQTPISEDGSSSSNAITPVGTWRYDSSLGD